MSFKWQKRWSGLTVLGITFSARISFVIFFREWVGCQWHSGKCSFVKIFQLTDFGQKALYIKCLGMEHTKLLSGMGIPKRFFQISHMSIAPWHSNIRSSHHAIKKRCIFSKKKKAKCVGTKANFHVTIVLMLFDLQYFPCTETVLGSLWWCSKICRSPFYSLLALWLTQHEISRGPSGKLQILNILRNSILPEPLGMFSGSYTTIHHFVRIRNNFKTRFELWQEIWCRSTMRELLNTTCEVYCIK